MKKISSGDGATDLGSAEAAPISQDTIVSAVEEIDRLRACVAEVRALHSPAEEDTRFCGICLVFPPCATMRILERHGL